VKRLLCSIVILFCWVSQAQERWVLDSKSSFITYEASHFLHDWSGTNQNVKGLLIKNEDFFKKIAIAMYVRDFDSKNSNRDNNALEILDVLQFPKIEFFSAEIENKNSELKFYGELNFHGIKLNTDIIAEAILEENNLLLKGDFDFVLSDFEVPLPSFMLRKMEDEIEIKFELYYRKLDR
jgi:polyisoprenoid-binding protein YceI